VTKINPVLDWLETEGARYSETAKFLDAFANELLKAGVDLARSTTGIQVLHPQVDSLSCLWQQGKPTNNQAWGDGDDNDPSGSDAHGRARTCL